jgi:hypothetical protein
MKDKPPVPPAGNRRRSRLLPRFSMATLVLATILISVLSAAVHYGGQAVRAGVRFEAMVVLLLVIAPPLLFFTMKIAHAVLSSNQDEERDDK